MKTDFFSFQQVYCCSKMHTGTNEKNEIYIKYKQHTIVLTHLKYFIILFLTSYHSELRFNLFTISSVDLIVSSDVAGSTHFPKPLLFFS